MGQNNSQSTLVKSSIWDDCKGFQPVNIDLQKYMGTWYETFRLNSWFEPEGLNKVTAQYSLLSNQTVDVVNSGLFWNFIPIKAHGIATPVASSSNSLGALSVKFDSSPVPGSYIVLYVSSANRPNGPDGPGGQDYSTAIVGTCSRKQLWTLTRQPIRDAKTLTELKALTMSVALQNGYSQAQLDKLVTVPQ